ncbi:MAG: hypothetical protein J0J14_07970 [Hyphomicrobium sp.]|nr:hypothetical protein [Hyphomicrobium sp.]MBN9265669.1 hypothetical protein [Hyphomicrobium sp.]
MTMIEKNAATPATEIRALTVDEIDDVGGAAISLGTYIRRLIWQIQNAPENSTLVGCSNDMSSCTWQSN